MAESQRNGSLRLCAGNGRTRRDRIRKGCGAWLCLCARSGRSPVSGIACAGPGGRSCTLEAGEARLACAGKTAARRRTRRSGHEPDCALDAGNFAASRRVRCARHRASCREGKPGRAAGCSRIWTHARKCRTFRGIRAADCGGCDERCLQKQGRRKGCRENRQAASELKFREIINALPHVGRYRTRSIGTWIWLHAPAYARLARENR